nr:MAG TPA: hypothetical protein [Caudoviricetes sp.]DAL45773.1 MAG TPA_asm: hypothetical protein [Bacteriophage sp.]
MTICILLSEPLYPVHIYLNMFYIICQPQTSSFSYIS